MKINLVVGEPTLISVIEGEAGGIYKTTLTHPKLGGALFFFHSENNRDAILETFTNSLQEDMRELMVLVNELVPGKNRPPAPG